MNTPSAPSQTMVGDVIAFEYGFYTVSCPGAASHLRTLHLRPWQMNKAEVGDRVKLEYQITSYSGLWNVVEILR